MFGPESTLLAALAFSGVAVALVAGLGWWLYLSPIGGGPFAAVAPSSGLARALAAVLGLGGLSIVAGGWWDGVSHITTGRIPSGSDFLWPPHLVIYGGFLLMFVGGLTAARSVTTASGDSRLDIRTSIRRSPWLGLVALASLYELLAIPGDALWHQLFGPDLTAWSLPHVLLAGAGALVLLAAAMLLLRAHPARPVPGVEIAAAILLGLMLNVLSIVAVAEWELPGGPIAFVLARPAWLYPFVGGAVAFLVLWLARLMLELRWAATAVAIAFYVARVGIALALQAGGTLSPHPPLVFLLGAVLLDAVAYVGRMGDATRAVAAAAAFATGYVVLGVPLLGGGPNVRQLTPGEVATLAVATLCTTIVIAVASTGLIRRGRLRAPLAPAPTT